MNGLSQIIDRDLQPVPPQTPVDELHHLTNWDWVRLAASGDLFPPVLGAVRRDGNRAVATDRSLDDLLVDCVPDLELVDLEGAWEVLRVAVPGALALGHGAGRVVVDAGYLAEALLGAVRPDGSASRILLTAGLPAITSVRLEFPDLWRSALVMPMRDVSAELDLNAQLRWLRGPGESSK